MVILTQSVEGVLIIVSLSISSLSSKNTPKFFVHVACGRNSVLLRRRCDMLCTSGFVDDVVFSRNGTMAHHLYS